MSGDRRKRKQATLADLHSNFRSMLPSHAVPRGRLKNALVKTARGVGKSQFVIPDRWMKYPQNETSNVVDNRKCGLPSLVKRWRCPYCCIGPYANLSSHKNRCPCKTTLQRLEARKRADGVGLGTRNGDVSSLLRAPAPKKLKTSTSSSSSSSSSLSF